MSEGHEQSKLYAAYHMDGSKNVTFQNIHDMWKAVCSGGKTVTDLEKEKKIAEAKLTGEEHEKQAKTLIVIEIHPKSGVETAASELHTVVEGVKKMQHMGIQNWGEEAKVEDVAFGVKKLTMSVTVFNKLIGTHDINDMIMEKYGDVIEHIDVVAMSKV
uniref:Translation elongation factor EF1B beta/delta subunit guanine nucleotide exchange domain-containing protein n=1 Tax=Aplanochytrium stocchinoi TaxID=215587 RepID=A0A7S3PSI0_9STRA|mmetsp:Transcript_3715/g.4641  ORF Transcript_3715/g.4641 Transcript_3715/m.4641 type:complete len:159 (-) Transcript_3715:232-708(-)|eukprot:CAMPEP_0204848438 /NCGR_PEP_ID=MMETSP1347-20130617/4120_1 /ASSEMBLY_ACC=CAM_ASM_000690 /TAXON_ID=215587 /ORGANISM="Aplanochytrium stocchinoi, Strain GSBS06" /LENGTH=158 /DNA_ID=CAMNT_0051989983 /DNA_START=111 /DNA_END=587 /DNA_ORIENTATION=+